MAENPLTILIIDDDAGDRALCCRSLKSALGENLRLLEADTGERGLSTIEENALSCVLLDYSLPGINGVEVLRRIRVKRPYLPVVMIDGKGNDVIAVQTMKAGGQDYISKKTITPPTLQRVVQMAIQHSALREYAQAQHESLEVFSRALAHDLKEPVRTIRSFVNMIDDWESLCARSQVSFKFIRKAADRLGTLIDAVYLYTRLDSAEGMEKAMCAGADILNEARENLTQLIRERGASITCDALPDVYANRGQMIRLFQNLLGNSIQHCDSAVTIHVSAKEYQDCWQFAVQDNGPGIARGYVETIFEPFKRLSHRKEDTRGLGLGLAINKKIVKAHGGEIWCESERGAGTSILFTLPKGVAALSYDVVFPIESINEQALAATQTIARLLLVDDDEGDIILGKAMLIERPNLHCEVLAAYNGEEALTQLQESKKTGQPIDLVLLDINMPVMNGFELLEQMRERHMLQETLVVICSTSDADVDRRKAALLGAVGYLTKPADFSDFKDVLERSGRFRVCKEGDRYNLVRLSAPENLSTHALCTS